MARKFKRRPWIFADAPLEQIAERVGAENLTLLPDARHMNIEEVDPARVSAPNAIADGGPILLETTAPAPNSYAPEMGGGFQEIVELRHAPSL